MSERLEAVLREMEEYSDSCAERNRGLAGRIWGWATDIRNALKDSEKDGVAE